MPPARTHFCEVVAARERRLGAAGEIVLERDHAGIGEHQRRVVPRDERPRRHVAWPFFSKKSRKWERISLTLFMDRSGQRDPAAVKAPRGRCFTAGIARLSTGAAEIAAATDAGPSGRHVLVDDVLEALRPRAIAVRPIRARAAEKAIIQVMHELNKLAGTRHGRSMSTNRTTTDLVGVVPASWLIGSSKISHLPVARQCRVSVPTRIDRSDLRSSSPLRTRGGGRSMNAGRVVRSGRSSKRPPRRFWAFPSHTRTRERAARRAAAVPGHKTLNPASFPVPSQAGTRSAGTFAHAPLAARMASAAGFHRLVGCEPPGLRLRDGSQDAAPRSAQRTPPEGDPQRAGTGGV